MADCESVVPELEEEEKLIASTALILRALESKENLTDDTKKILIDLGNQLSTITTDSETEGEEISEIGERLNVVQETIMSWEGDQSMIWDLGPDKAFEYLNAADEAQKLTKRLESLCLNKDDEEKELLQRAQNVLQKGMARLEEEFRHILIQSRQPYEPWRMSFRSSEEDFMDEGSLVSFGDVSGEYSPYRDSVSRASEEFNIDLIHPDLIPDLRGIANLMFNSNYIHECTQSYITIRKDALDEYLSNLQVENLNTDDVLRKEWVRLDFKIKRWGLAVKKFVRVYLVREKLLSDHIFGEIGSVNLECFVKVSKDSMLQLLNFGQAISIAPYRPEKLFHILDIYEVLADLLPDLDSLYTGSSTRIGCPEVLKIFAGFASATFLEFKNSITFFTSTESFKGGGIHPLTRHVMNYIKALTDYVETLNLIFNFPQRLQSIASSLESSLYNQSKLYKDAALQHFFLMNNIHYIAKKFKDSELRLIIGDEWIRKHASKFQEHAMNYERATWSPVLTLLKFEQNYSSNSVLTRILKGKLQSFILAFEDVYKTQTAWVVPDVQLREELRISVSIKVIQAYFTFIGRTANHIGYKHIKYTADDIENYLLDLFEGPRRSLNDPRRR